jgi:hypothetical protein
MAANGKGWRINAVKLWQQIGRHEGLLQHASDLAAGTFYILTALSGILSDDWHLIFDASLVQLNTSIMKVKVELLLTRTITINVVENDVNDLAPLVQQLQRPGQEGEHFRSIKIIEVNGRQVGSSLEPGSALQVSSDKKIVKFRQMIPSLLHSLGQSFKSRHAICPTYWYHQSFVADE